MKRLSARLFFGTALVRPNSWGGISLSKQIKMATYLREAYWLPVILCFPLLLALLAMNQWFVPHTYAQLIAHLSVAAAVYGLSLGWAIASKRAMRVGALGLPDSVETEPAAMEGFSKEI